MTDSERTILTTLPEPGTLKLDPNPKDPSVVWILGAKGEPVAKVVVGPKLAQLFAAAPDLLDQARKLLALMDMVAIDSRLGDETDRVFPHYEFNGIRDAIAKAAPKE